MGRTTRLSWTTASTNVSGFKLYKLEGGDYVQIGTFAAHVREHFVETTATTFRIRGRRKRAPSPQVELTNLLV